MSGSPQANARVALVSTHWHADEQDAKQYRKHATIQPVHGALARTARGTNGELG